MKNVADSVKTAVRGVMRGVARGLDKLSGGRVTPNMVTWLGLVMHLPIMWLIATGRPVPAAVLLVVFGLFDTLDGELARLTGKTSDAGGILDAVTDRLKEAMLYSGIAWWFSSAGLKPMFVAATVLACGASVAVSYVKSKGETIVAAQGREHSYAVLNRMFGGGLLPFEIRMLLLVVGLFAGLSVLKWIVAAVALLATFTVFQRLARIMRSVR